MQNEMYKKYLDALEYNKVLALVSNCAVSNDGKKAVLGLTPFFKKDEIEFSINLTTEAKAILDLQGVNSVPIDGAFDPDKILTTSRISIEEISKLTKTLTTSRLLKNFLSKNKEAKKLGETYIEALISNKELEDKIYSFFDSDFNIKDDATEQLKSLKASLYAAEGTLKNSISSLLKNPDFTNCLQDTIVTERMNRTVFQVKAVDKSKVKGIVHDVSSTNQTFFIEPEILVSINNKIRQIECGIEGEIERIICEATSLFQEIKPSFIIAYRAIVELDVIFAKAKYSILTKSTPPLISDKKVIKLYSMRHPLLGKDAVQNDFVIGEDYKSVLITGSNTGGKTVAMKTIGLFVLMAKTGMHVQAENSEIYPFNYVYSDIEEKQDITQSLSTFSAHIKNISYIIDNAKTDDLVLFDELGAGTDPTEGSSLARAILEYLAKKDIVTISTTHLGELKILEYQNDYFKNASVEFDKETMKPTYKITIGLAGSSYAIDIAKNYGIKEEILDWARNILSQNSNQNTKVFNKIQETHQEILKNAQKIEESRVSAEIKEEELKEKIKEIKEKKKKTLESFKKKYRSGFEIARKEIKEILDTLREEKSEKIVRRAYSRLAKLEEDIRREFTKDEDEISEKYPEIDWNNIKIGQTVLVRGINQAAVLKSMPDEKQNVEIQIGLIKSKIHISKLAKTDKKVNKGIKKLSVSFDDFHNSLEFSPRLDLRGLRVEEALDEIEGRLDLAIRRNISQFTIIHGHGTGALKKAIREYLKESPYVLKFRPGSEEEGGDGVSVVDVK